MDWTALRAEMPVVGRWAFFDHAAVAPLPAAAQLALAEYAADLAENGVANVMRWVERVEEVRGLAARLLNADPLDVAFVKNTSEGIGIVAEGFPWQPGDNVVTAQEEYPANLYPWMNLRDRGVEVRTVASRGSRLDIDDFRAAIDSRTRVLTVSFVEYASGFRNDLAALGSLCREQGIFFFVDAIQGLGVFPLDVRALPVDALAADGHKWLLGPEGAGIFYLRRERVEQLRPLGVGWNSVARPLDFATIDFQLKPHAGRYESGSHNVAGITALGAALQLLLEIGVPEISRRIRELTDHLCARLQLVGFEVFSSRRAEEWSGIVSISAPGPDARSYVKFCRSQGIVSNHRADRIRVSPHCYNTIEEIDRLVDCLAAQKANSKRGG